MIVGEDETSKVLGEKERRKKEEVGIRTKKQYKNEQRKNERKKKRNKEQHTSATES